MPYAGCQQCRWAAQRCTRCRLVRAQAAVRRRAAKRNDPTRTTCLLCSRPAVRLADGRLLARCEYHRAKNNAQSLACHRRRRGTVAAAE